MIVQRFTFKAKVGCESEVIKLVKDMVEEFGFIPRVCSYVFGPLEIVTSEVEFESIEARQRFYDEVDWSGPKAAEWLKRRADLTESGTTIELFRVH